MFKHTKLCTGLIVAFGGLTVLPNVALAQADAALQKVEVTGSRIKRADSEGAVPITVITRETLEASGATTVADFVRNSTFSTSGNFRPNSGSSAQSFAEVNLRGLGSRRTLVLVDGRRVAKSPTVGDAVDMNTIPMAAVERIEILTDGASAVYGSDAIGGVVNVILRKDFEGVAVTYGKSKPTITGGATETMSGLIGIRGDKGNMVAGVSHTSRDIIFVRDYPWGYTRGASSFSNNYFTNGGDAAGPFGVSFIKAVPGGCTNPGFYSNSRCRYDFNLVAADEAAVSADSFYARGEIRISDDWSAYLNQSVSRSQSFGRYAPVPANIFIAKGSAGDILSATGQGDLVPAEGMVLMHRFAAGGNRDTSTDNSLYDIAAGVKGRLGPVDAEFGARHTQSKYFETGRGYVVRSLAEKAINEGLYNIVNPISSPQSVIQSFTTNTGRESEFTQKEIYANGQVDLFKMGGGNAILFASLEKRNEYYQDLYDSLSEAGVVEGSAGNSAGGGRDVTEMGVEMVMPLTKTIEASLAARAVRYSDYGSDVSPKASVRWQPMKTLTLRASAGKGFAAPTLPQLTQKPSFSADSIIDQAHCKADDPSNTTEFCDEESFQINGTVISNPNLKSEKSTQFSLGGAWDVTPMLTVKADYWSTKIDDVLVNVSAQTIVNRNNGTSSLPIPQGLSITRNAQGSIIALTRGATNEGVLQLRGIDAAMTFGSYSLFGFGKVRHDLNWSRVLTAESNGSDYLGSFETPRDRIALSTKWNMGDFEATWNTNVIGKHGEDALEVQAYVTHDLQFAYHPKALKGTRFVVGAVNAFNRYPELISDSSKPFSYNLYDGYGMQPYFRAEVKF